MKRLAVSATDLDDVCRTAAAAVYRIRAVRMELAKCEQEPLRRRSMLQKIAKPRLRLAPQ